MMKWRSLTDADPDAVEQRAIDALARVMVESHAGSASAIGRKDDGTVTMVTSVAFTGKQYVAHLARFDKPESREVWLVGK